MKFSMKLPEWLKKPLIALVHKALDEKLNGVTDRTAEFADRIEKLERIETLMSRKIERLAEDVVCLRALAPEVAALKERVLAHTQALDNVWERFDFIAAHYNSAITTLQKGFNDLHLKISAETTNRSGAIETLRYDFQKDVDRLDSLFRHSRRAARRVKLEKKTA